METAEKERYTNINDREPCENTAGQGFFNTTSNRWNVFFWNNTTFDFIEEFIALAFFFLRPNFEPAMTILSATSRLFDIFSFSLRFGFDCFSICHLRLTKITFDSMCSL